MIIHASVFAIQPATGQGSPGMGIAIILPDELSYSEKSSMFAEVITASLASLLDNHKHYISTCSDSSQPIQSVASGGSK